MPKGREVLPAVRDRSLRNSPLCLCFLYRITVVASRNISAGNEVTNHYKDSSNVHMLYNWGFTQPGNTTDWIPGWTSDLLGLPPFSSDALFSAAANLWQQKPHQQHQQHQLQYQQKNQQQQRQQPYSDSSRSSSSGGSNGSSSGSSSSPSHSREGDMRLSMDVLIDNVTLRRLVTAVSVLAFYSTPMPGQQERLQWPEVEDGSWRPQEQLTVQQVLSYIEEKFAEQQQRAGEQGRERKDGMISEAEKGEAGGGLSGSTTSSSSSSGSGVWQYSSDPTAQRQQQTVAALAAECRLLLLECKTTAAEDQLMLDMLLSRQDLQRAVQQQPHQQQRTARSDGGFHSKQYNAENPVPNANNADGSGGDGGVDTYCVEEGTAAAAGNGGDGGDGDGGLDAVREVQCKVCAALEVLHMLENLPPDAEPGLKAAAADEQYLEELRGYVALSDKRDEMMQELEWLKGIWEQQHDEDLVLGLLKNPSLSRSKLVIAVAARLEQKLLLQTAVELCWELCAALGER